MKGCRERGVSPHCAQIEGRQVEGLDARTTKKGGYKASLIVRRRIEQIFGWAKSIGGLSKSAHRGMERVNAACQYVGGAYNLLRMARLSSHAPPTEVGHKPRVGRTAPKTPLAGRKTARKEAEASQKARTTSEKVKRFSNHDVSQQPANRHCVGLPTDEHGFHTCG